MIRNIVILTFNDMAIALKNKSIFLILFIPLFVFISISLIDKTDAKIDKINMGLISDQAYPSDMVQGVSAADGAVSIAWLENEQDGISLLKEHKLDGLLIRNKKSPYGLVLLVLKEESPRTLAIMEIFSALQKVAEGNHPSWIANIEPLHEGGIQRTALPTWILMLILLVSFIIMPAQVAEEKEKKLLLALLQTPISELEWLIAKVITGMALIITAVLLLHLLGRLGQVSLFSYIAFIVVGSFSFGAFGIFLGFLCHNQASARTLGVIFYLPLLLPSALSEVSQKLTSVAPLLPSYQLYIPLQSILLEGGNGSTMLLEWMYLLLMGVLMFYLALGLMKKRWLM